MAGSMPSATPGTSEREGPPSRRREAILLGVLSALLVALTLGIEAALDSEIDVDSLSLPLGLSVVFFAAHFVVRWLAPYSDQAILPAVAALNGIGVTFIWRLELGAMSSAERLDSSTLIGDGLRQTMWTFAAVVCFAAVLFVVRDHRVLARFAYTAGLVGMVLLMAPAVLPSRYSEVNNAKIWIVIPVGSGFSVQPGEFAKLALVVFFAAYLVAKRDVLSVASKRFLGLYLPRGRDLGPVAAAWLGAMMVVVFERDLGSALMFFGIFIVMLYVATERTSWLIIGLGMFAAGAVIAWRLFSHVQLRVNIWLDPFADADGDGFQIVQSLFGLGTGGLFGTGPGAGNPELLQHYAKSDFIIATLGEEIGLFGLVGLLMLYLIISERGIRASLDVRDSFGKLLAGGLAFSVALQVFVIVGGVSKLIPLTGLTTPFLSYGGSSLVANWMLAALLLRISDAGRRPVPRRPTVLQLRDAPTEVVKLA